MIPLSRRYRVALAGYYGFDNLGDELLAEASIALLERCGVERGRIVVLSGAPENSKRKFGTDAVDRWKPGEVVGALKRSDTLLFGGGGLFQDATSLHSCFYYWSLVRLACFCGAVPWAIGQSVGPLAGRTGRFLARDALRRCPAVQVRDGTSRTLCETMGLSVKEGYDLVFLLGDVFLSKTAESSKTTSSPLKFLVNFRPCADGLAERFAHAVAEWGASMSGTFLGVALADEDERLMHSMIERGKLPPMSVERIAGLDDAARVWNGAIGAAGMRFHFAVLSALAGVPLTVAPYDPKVSAFASAWNIPAWQEGVLPLPGVPSAPAGYSGPAVAEKAAAFCREILG